MTMDTVNTQLYDDQLKAEEEEELQERQEFDVTRPEILTMSEKKSPLWLKISKLMKERLEFLRQENDTYISVEKSNQMSGQIIEAKYVLSLGEIPEKINETEEPVETY